MWKACRKRAPTELEPPSSPSSDSDISSPTPPSPSPNPRRPCSPVQNTHIEAAPTPPSPQIAREHRGRVTAHDRSDADGEPGQLGVQIVNKSCSLCKSSKASSWQTTVIDGKNRTVCTACNVALWRAHRHRSTSSTQDSAMKVVVNLVSSSPARPPVELPLARKSTSIVRQDYQENPENPDVKPLSGARWQLSRSQATGWSNHRSDAKADHKPGQDLAALAHSLEWLSKLLERVCNECSVEQIRWLEQHLMHEWKVDEMTIFVHGFLAGVAATDYKMGASLALLYRA